MAHANHEGVGRRIPIGTRLSALAFNLVVHIAHDAVDVGALAERIVIADRHNPAGEIKIVRGAVSLFGIHVGRGSHHLAAGNRSVNAEANAIALDLQVSRVGGAVKINTVVVDDASDAADRHFIEVLSAEVGLGDFEVPAAAEGDGQAVVNVSDSAVRSGGGVVDGVNAQEDVGRAVGVGRRNAVVAVGRRLVFAFVIAAHGVHGRYLEAGKRRRTVDDRVLVTGRGREHVAGLSRVVTEARAKRRQIADERERALALIERADAAESELAEVAFEEEHRFTIEHGVVVGAAISRETVFKNEAHRQTVAEVFRALQAPAGAELLAGFHREVVEIVTLAIHINVAVVEAKVNNAVERHVGSKGRTGKRAENCNGG